MMGHVETQVQLLAFYSRSLASGHFVFCGGLRQTAWCRRGV